MKDWLLSLDCEGEASDGQQRTSERVTHANRRTIQTMLYNIQTLGSVDWKPGDTGICWLKQLLFSFQTIFIFILPHSSYQ